MNDKYWELLQEGLRTGYSEQRKYCLSILKTSVQILNIDLDAPHMTLQIRAKMDYVLHFDKYITVFETIVLGRYMNQVEECLPDLQMLCSSSSRIHPTWMKTLLEAAFQQNIQDGIRKFVGNWLMDLSSLYLDLDRPTQEGGHRLLITLITQTSPKNNIITQSLLPWATQGSLFTSSIRSTQDNRTVCCEHGEKLSSFIEGLLRRCPDNTIRSLHLRTLLTWLHDTSIDGRLFPHAAAYIVDGLVRGAGLQEPICRIGKGAPLDVVVPGIEQQDLELLVKIATRTGLPEVVRDYLVALCLRIESLLKRTSPGSAMEGFTYTTMLARHTWLLAPVTIEKLTALELQKWLVHAAIEASGPSASANNHYDEDEKGKIIVDLGSRNLSLTEFIKPLVLTNYELLHGSGLNRSCRYLFLLLNNNSSDTVPSNLLLQALEAIWSEVERQDYPKQSLMEVPNVFFHPTSIKLSVDAPELAALLSSTLAILQQLCDGRIYVFSPLAKALSNAYRKAPEVTKLLPFEDFIVQIANHPPSPKLEFLLDSSVAEKLEQIAPHRTYSFYYGHHQSYGYACIFDTLNSLRVTDHAVGKRIFDRLLEPWANQKMPISIVSKWKKTTQLQTMLLLLDTCMSTSTSEELSAYLRSLLSIISIEPLPRYRFLLEWIIARIYVQHPDRRPDLLTLISTKDHSNPKYLASIMKLAVMIARVADSPESFALKLMTQLVPLSASSKIIIRHEAQWSFPPLWDHAAERDWTSITENPAFAALNDSIRSHEKYLAPPPGRSLEWLDPVDDHNLATLFQGGYLRMEPAEGEIVRVEDFEELWAEKENTRSGEGAEKAMPPPRVPLGRRKPQAPSTPAAAQETESQDTIAHAPSLLSPATATTPTPLQTKPQTLPLLSPSRPLSTDPLDPSTRPTPLIIIASLIANPHNLGGLSRISEIFGAASLHLRTTAVLTDRDFLAVSVSSHLHLSIHALPPTPSSLLPFLRERKGEGYTVVGIEQTDASFVLGAPGTSVPRKAVLVLGSEREGIPGWLLSEMDACVEIGQVGRTRSLNVQTAAGCVLFEWWREHGGGGGG
ncbi:hypothetical protein W97_09037 [Coniosporium apollinis CBS 100218]|uniref:tRNA/rRNA methyltransferase SpoU type domain-containing protein n=1 Tax=Coniosporium apollinis (strain CBS 100218) TaxID=1168221 RepID=R7Z6Y5_CONA1|nr:uncharacterized protein W97_09037 [Coniosporium apollinis CBS 100218]EON69774.1 hypothetical protein W97_09037 [Coniosporium apollinis CBS 100218]